MVGLEKLFYENSILLKRLQSKTVSRRKLHKTLSYERPIRKMLVKLITAHINVIKFGGKDVNFNVLL